MEEVSKVYNFALVLFQQHWNGNIAIHEPISRRTSVVDRKKCTMCGVQNATFWLYFKFEHILIFSIFKGEKYGEGMQGYWIPV